MLADKILVKNLENKIKELSKLNEDYKTKIKKLESIFNNMQSAIQELKFLHLKSLAKESEYQNEKLEVAQKNQKIVELEGDILKLKLEHEKYKHKKELEYDNDVTAVKNFYETNLLKINNSTVVEETNRKFYEHILLLEDIICNFKEEQKKKDAQKEVDFENKMNEMKKKMLDYIKEGQKSKQYLSKEQLRLNDKLSVIHKNTLLNELDFQSMQLEDLLKQREHLDNIILGMKSDIEVHQKVEKILTEKNKRYTNMIKVLSTKVESKEKSKENEKSGKKNKSMEKKEGEYKPSKFKFFEPNNNFIRIPNNKNNLFVENNKKRFKLENKIEIDSKTINVNSSNDSNSRFKKLKKINNNLSSPNLSADNIENNNDIIQLRKELVKRIKEAEDYKSKYECYKTKLDTLNDKYGNIMKLFEDVLSKIYEDKNMENIRNIYINFEDFKSCEFEKLSSEQKYSIVILIIKYLIPLINPNNLPEKFKSFFCNIEDVAFINDKNNNILSSTTYNSSNKPNFRSGRRNDFTKTRIKSSSSDFGKTQIIFDNKYQKQINSATINNNKLDHLINPQNKKVTNRHFLKFINRQGSRKSFGKTGFSYKYSSLLSNFFNSLEADSNNNYPEFHKSYSLFNI